jgi:hypothetical protein
MWKISLCAILLASLAPAQAPSIPTIAAKTAGMRKLDGYFPFYWDDRGGAIWLEISRFDSEFLYITSLPAGLGSNDTGLDRGVSGGGVVLRFERSGPKILLIQPNYNYRAGTADPDQRRTVEESFARSTLWGFEVAAEENGRVLVDATPFLLRDATDVAGTLRRLKQGDYRFDAARSTLYLPRTRNFPKNTEFEATITLALTRGEPGKFVSEVTPRPDAITLRVHQSFVELPGPGYEPRAFDPRAGFFGVRYMDLMAPLGAPVFRQFLSRHRLRKKNPNAPVSDPVEPIVYYLDRGAPEPLRSALLEGARWWTQAFDAAGYRNAFRVELLPEGADPMDIRYNVIQWVHRSTRGWSYGGGIIDPRTGEIIKGQVTLGSLRARQDYRIAEGLLAPYEDGKPVPADMENMALARLRQLAAHEVGHTLGLQHNFAASFDHRASVMDYPPPVAVLRGAGAPDLASAYATGIGEWDKAAIAYGYQDFPPGTDEGAALRKMMDATIARGLHYLTDEDARPIGSASPIAHLWDSGRNAVDELQRVIEVRKRVLERFGENNIRQGEPLATLEDTLVPAYLMHRYQTEAAAKVLGGVNYTYALRGDGQIATRPVPASEQRRAAAILLRTLNPDFLTLPPRLIALIPPRPPGFPRTNENFPNHTGLTFDPLGAVQASANITAGLLLDPERGERLVQQHAADPSVDGLETLIGHLLAATWNSTAPDGVVRQVVNEVILVRLMALAANTSASAAVRAAAFGALSKLEGEVRQRRGTSYLFAAARIKRFLEHPAMEDVPSIPEPPPGQPIGEILDWN